MSWILGVIGDSIPEDLRQKIRSSCDTPLHTIQRENDFYLIAGGSADTLHCIDTPETCALIAGCGLSVSDTSTTILTTNDWKSITGQTQPPLTSLNGNFSIIRYRNKTVECYSDKVGLRTMYFGKYKQWWILSSRLSLVCRFLPESKINWSIFGPRWISSNQISFNSQVSGVDRLPPNGYIKIENGSFIKQSTPWLSPIGEETSAKKSKDILRALTKINDRHIRIGFSGGLDSRTLLATVSSQSDNFSTYSFGCSDEPDIILAKKITEHEKIPFHNFLSDFPSQDECIRIVHQYIQQTNLVGSASLALRLRYYPLMRFPAMVQFDGGGGEVARRQLLNRLHVFAHNDILTLNPKNILSHALIHRADIFNEETNTSLSDGAVNEIDNLIHSLPDPKEIGVENFLDRWAAQVIIPNVACDAQARIDEFTLNYMPFSQPVFMDAVLKLPAKERKNNRLFKDIISVTRPSLSKFPLIKNNIQYPYRLSMLQMRVWTKMRLKFGSTYVDQTPFLLLDTLKEYVMDILHSQTVQEYPHYDLQKISASVSGYYNGEKRLADEVNWWIAFEVWRQSVENNKAGN